MRDRRDIAIAVLAAALLFCVGVLVGGGGILPAASAQGGGPGGANPNQRFNPEQPMGGDVGQTPGNPEGGGITIGGGDFRPGTRTTARYTTDSNSNNRFVAVTSPIGSGESVLFLIDSKTDQLAVYRFVRGKGLTFLAARKIDYDLRVTGYEDISKYSRDEMKRMYERSIAKAAAEAAKKKKG